MVQRVWNVYRGPCKLSCRRMIWLRPLRKLPLFLSLPVCRQLSLQRGGRGWGRSQIIQRGEKTWSSINHSILSGVGEWQGVWRGTAVSLVNCVFGLVYVFLLFVSVHICHNYNQSTSQVSACYSPVIFVKKLMFHEII